MAYFGAPVPSADHASDAVRAAVDLQQAIAERNTRLAPLAVPAEVGIGIHTGVVVVGNIGSDRRTDFTTIGDAVNVAHRLEKLARPGEILVSEAVQRRVRDTVKLRFEGERQLSGRVEPVHVYSVEVPPRVGRAAPAATAPARGPAPGR
jgi:class 3 adenylate cyclase